MSKVKIISNEPGKCPYCTSLKIEYDALYRDTNYVIYPARCKSCHRIFEEWYRVTFEGINVGRNCEYQAEDYDEIEYEED